MAYQHGDGFPSRYKGTLLLPRPSNSALPAYSFRPLSSSSSSSVVGRRAALTIHSQAEKRRRERINAHLSTLRRMVPDAHKMDKASLLARVVDQLKSLKRKAVDVGKGFTIPTDMDEVSVVECHGIDDPASSSSKIIYIKASVCCDDRPELFADITQAFDELKLRTIRAEMTSLGGRVRNVFVLCCKDGNGGAGLSTLKESTRKALARVASSDMGSEDAFSGKRQRLMQSHCFGMSL